MSKFLNDSFCNVQRLFGDLRAYSVTGKYCNIQFHTLFYFQLSNPFSITFSIFSVAIMAAWVWSVSSPRVLNSWLNFQVITVSTSASVRPPGGMAVSYTHLRAHETGRNLV